MKPILKWAGGKTALLDKIKERMPVQYGTYFEPFVGGGAVFLNLSQGKAVINDKNRELINCYIQVRDHLEDLLLILDELQTIHSEEKYYELRSDFNIRKAENKYELYDAALMIYLNRAGFNGMYRENSSGNFNIPSGKKKTVILYERENFQEVSEKLKKAIILNEDFESAVKTAKEGDFVYFDSPYDDTFDEYQKGGFPRSEHERLSKLCDKLTDNNIYFMLSSSDSEFIKNLYNNYSIDEVQIQRTIGLKRARKIETELLIMNY